MQISNSPIKSRKTYYYGARSNVAYLRFPATKAPTFRAAIQETVLTEATWEQRVTNSEFSQGIVRSYPDILTSNQRLLIRDTWTSASSTKAANKRLLKCYRRWNFWPRKYTPAATRSKNFSTWRQCTNLVPLMVLKKKKTQLTSIYATLLQLSLSISAPSSRAESLYSHTQHASKLVQLKFRSSDLISPSKYCCTRYHVMA